MGQYWGVDHSATYATLVLGGFNGFFTFVELSCGYGIPFLLKSKLELEACTRQLSHSVGIMGLHGEITSLCRHKGRECTIP